MGHIGGTQEFLAAHKDHTTSISMLQTFDTRYVAKIGDSNFGLHVGLCDVKSREWVQTTGAYLYCHDCTVEEEINVSEVEDDDEDCESHPVFEEALASKKEGEA